MARQTEIVGMRELIQTMRQLERIPAKTVSKAARAGAKVALKDAKSNAPRKSGLLKRSLYMRIEKSKKKLKKVFRIRPNPKYNEIFQKPVTNVGLYGGYSPIAYYPSSMEYGFPMKSTKFEGKHYLLNSIDDNANTIRKKVVDVLASEIDKLR